MVDQVALRVCYFKILAASWEEDGLTRDVVETALEEFFEEALEALEEADGV